MKNHNVLITGATAGIGRAISILLATQDYNIFLIGRSEDKLENLKNELHTLGMIQKFSFSITDLTNLQAIEKQIQLWESEHGSFEVLINNAGIGFGSVLGRSFKDLQYLIQTNLTSYMWLAGYIGNKMINKSIDGHIIHIGSMSANTKDANSSGYVATKSGIKGFTEVLRKELNPYNIHVTLIEPGKVGTDMQSTTYKEEQKLQEKLEILKAEDIAAVVLYVLQQNKRVDICEIKIKPLKQII